MKQPTLHDMKQPTLDDLLLLARRHRLSDEERHEQGISFILGNVAADGEQLYRGTVTMAVPRSALNPNQTVGSIVVDESEPRIPFNVNGAVRQFRLVQHLVEQHLDEANAVRIDPNLIRQLHAASGDPRDPEFGSFRTIEVQVGAYRAPSSHDIETLVDAFCADLKSRWNTESAADLAAFVLWKLNWIHPFVDANGRTARALSYLTLNLKLGLLLPGSPTLLEQLSSHRSRYLSSLAIADKSYAASGTANLRPLGELLEALLSRQLRNLPAQSDQDEMDFSEIYSRRLEHAKADLLVRLYGDQNVAFRLWALGDIQIIHVGSAKALEDAEALFANYSRPFPGLIAGSGEEASMTIQAEQRGAIVRLRELIVADAALHLEPNAAVIVEAPQILFASSRQIKSWEVSGALYLVRSGEEIGVLGKTDVLDWLISRHLQER